MSQILTPFHLAIVVHDVKLARQFYVDVLGCEVGRSSDQWVDLDLFGHQLVCHEVQGMPIRSPAPTNSVDGHAVPIPHFGVVLDMANWAALAARLKAAAITFVIEPHIRFAGLPGEQATMFFHDPSGNALEFKGFKDIETELFKA
ncbi:MAG: extradiol dioxygenase family protein [Candidatus Pseudothioglobus sp.]|jgi:extradiol dioxygenase family protein